MAQDTVMVKACEGFAQRQTPRINSATRGFFMGNCRSFLGLAEDTPRDT